MSDIFLSYKSEDRSRAKIIAEALEHHGYSVWWDRIIPPGRTFDDVIEEELDASRCVVVLWSNESVKSKWVKTEASEGDKRGILVPVLIDNVKIPIEFRRIQAAQLIDWRGALPNPEFDLLLESVGQILGKSTETRMEDKKLSISEKRDRENKLPSKNALKSKWGSMIASLILILIFWFVSYYSIYVSGNAISSELVVFDWLQLLGFPSIIFLMYKERTAKINYGLVWILFPVLILLFGIVIYNASCTNYASCPDSTLVRGPVYIGNIFGTFIFLIIPAIIIDVLYVKKMSTK